MTRRSSVRAKAREIYCDLVSQKPVPSPQPDLTAQVRALYEDSAVPVREIARIAGVTERTIYKYVRKGHWTRRHRVTTARGAGARFIRREHHNQPVALGLKATDPKGAERAGAGCAEAEQLSGEAQAEAQRQRRAEACILWMEATCNAHRQLRDYLAARNARYAGRAPPSNDHVERLYYRILEVALSQWKALQAQEISAA